MLARNFRTNKRETRVSEDNNTKVLMTKGGNMNANMEQGWSINVVVLAVLDHLFRSPGSPAHCVCGKPKVLLGAV